MGGYEKAAFARLKHDLQQVARVEAQNGPAIGAEIADARETLVQAPGAVQIGDINQVMHLARLAVLLIDRGDLHLEHKTDVALGRTIGTLAYLLFQIAPQTIQAGFSGNQLILNFLEPAGMSEIAGGQQPDAFAPRPEGQVFQVAVAAGGPREFRMHVQVGIEHCHRASFPRLLVLEF